jgi:hypothetical protein
MVLLKVRPFMRGIEDGWQKRVTKGRELEGNS